MVSVKRPEVANRIHDAKEHGDLSENAEYEDAKNEQAFVEGRIQSLESMIKNATLIDEHTSTDHVQIGSTVEVESPDGAESFTIVGSTEARPNEGRISNESPVGRALLGRKKGEKVVVKVPAGDFTYKIVSIS
jgi:transcription elongation factor GreA